MEPQGEQADFELRHWDGSDDDDQDEEFEQETKWGKLLTLYSEIDGESKWSHLRRPGIRLVRGDGEETAETARVFICGEAPGAVENGAGRPFVGPSGRVLEGLLELAGLRREQCFITNVVKYRPQGNATPGAGEAFQARDALRREWSIINPILTIAIGAVAHRLLHPAEVALMNLDQGQLWTYGSNVKGRFVTSIFHPAFAMRNKRFQEPMEKSWELLGEQINHVDIREQLEV